MGKGKRLRTQGVTPILVPPESVVLPHGFTASADRHRAELDSAYKFIGVAVVAHASFEAQMNRLLLSLEGDSTFDASPDGRAYLPSKNFEMTRNLEKLIKSGLTSGALLKALKQLASAEKALRSLRNSVAHSFVSESTEFESAGVYFEDARTELGDTRIRRSVEELNRDAERVADEAAILSAIAQFIFARIRVKYASKLNLPAETLTPQPVNSIDPNFAKKLKDFLVRGQWIGWRTDGFGANPVHDEDWWK